MARGAVRRRPEPMVMYVPAEVAHELRRRRGLRRARLMVLAIAGAIVWGVGILLGSFALAAIGGAAIGIAGGVTVHRAIERRRW